MTIAMSEKLQHKPVRVVLPKLGISAFTSRHAADFEMDYRKDAFEKICLVREGRGELQSRGKRGELVATTLVRVPAERRYRFVDRIGAPMTLDILCIAPTALDAPASVAKLWRAVQRQWPAMQSLSIPSSYELGEYQRLFRSIVLELGHDLSSRDASVLALTTELLIGVRRMLESSSEAIATPASKNFAAIVARLDHQFTEPQRISDLAAEAGMCYRSFTDHFRRVKGMTVIQYITQRRIDFARRRMVETQDVFGSAQEAGFRDLGNFYRVFKRTFGKTPKAYIRQFDAATTQSK